MRINAVLCEMRGPSHGAPNKLCFPVSCEVSAGAICAIQSPNAVDFDHADSACVQSATALDYSKWMNRQRQDYYVQTQVVAGGGLNEPTWVEHCVCSISTRNWFLNSRSGNETAPSPEDSTTTGGAGDHNARREEEESQ